MDFEPVKQVIEIAGASGTAVKNLGAGVEAIKGLFKSRGEDMQPEVKSLLVDLASNVADAKLANAELTQKLADLQSALQKREAFGNRKARYSLVQTPAGEYLWQLKADQADGQPVHYACPICMEAERISILQGHQESVQCIPCDHWYKIVRGQSVYMSSGSR